MITLDLTEAQAKELRSILYRELDYYASEPQSPTPTAQLLAEQLMGAINEALGYDR